VTTVDGDTGADEATYQQQHSKRAANHGDTLNRTSKQAEESTCREAADLSVDTLTVDGYFCRVKVSVDTSLC
jgi:hypothetical protein